MGFTDKLTYSYSGNGSAIASVAGTYAGDEAAEYDDTINSGVSLKEIDIAFPVSTLQALAIVPATDMTILTNSTSAPGNTLNLKAGVGVMWGNQDNAACPLTAAVMKIFVTNAGTKAGRLQIRALYNSLP